MSLVVREIQIKTTMKYQFILSRIVIIIIKKIMSSVGEDMEKLEPSYIVVGM